jgi:hypothetical protein
MVTTDNEVFNALMDKLLSPEDRRLMLVTPKSPEGKAASIGCITFNPESIALMKRTRAVVAAQLEAFDTQITLSELGAKLGASIKEV